MAFPNETLNWEPVEKTYPEFANNSIDLIQSELLRILEESRHLFVTQNGRGQNIVDMRESEINTIKSVVSLIREKLGKLEAIDGLELIAEDNRGNIDISKDVTKYFNESATIISILNSFGQPHYKSTIESKNIDWLADYYFWSLTIAKAN